MSLFQLDPTSIAARYPTGNPPLPGLKASILRGVIGFTILSLLGFLPWPIMDHWFPHLREMELYLTCTAIFIGLSGPCLHRLILGSGSLVRFYPLFAIAFLAYASAWVACWMTLRGDAGSVGGLLAGTVAMAVILTAAFDAPRAFPAAAALLFALNTAGFYAGGWIEGKIAVEHRLAAILVWAICYGVGFGAGLGAAFHLCQARARALIRQNRGEVL
jgi:hypothetical protein